MFPSQQDSLVNPKERVPNKARGTSRRFPSERQLDWIGCDDFVLSPIDVDRSGKHRARMNIQGTMSQSLLLFMYR